MNNQGLEALAALASAVPQQAQKQGQGSSGVDSTEKAKPEAGGTTSDNNSVSGSSFSNATAHQAAPSNQPSQQISALLQSSMQGISPQQWQQVLGAAVGTGATQPSAPVNPMGAHNMALLAGIQQLQQGDPSALMALKQQLSYYQLLAQVNQPRPPPPTPSTGGLNAAAGQAIALALAGRNQAGLTATVPDPSASVSTTGQHTMPPPPPPATVFVANRNGPDASPSLQHTTIAPQPANSVDSGDDHTDEFETHVHGKKQQKRAANRRSAQLSRKRKKQFIEELKDENDGLRRKEQILKSIPDLIVVFDSSGKLWFVSESVSRFLDFKAGELEGSSFWSRLCEDSVRLLKAAFMDSLAARQPDSDTAPLGQGFWELQLVDKDGAHKVVTLNGVVHFAGDRPECVCSIRPQEKSKESAMKAETAQTDGASTSSAHKSLIQVEPQQSAIDRSVSSGASSRQRGNGDKDAVRISDSGNSSSSRSSESGSSDEQTMEQRTKVSTQ